MPPVNEARFHKDQFQEWSWHLDRGSVICYQYNLLHQVFLRPSGLSSPIGNGLKAHLVSKLYP